MDIITYRFERKFRAERKFFWNLSGSELGEIYMHNAVDVSVKITDLDSMAGLTLDRANSTNLVEFALR